MLPSQTVPLTSAGNTKPRLATVSNKRKAALPSAANAAVKKSRRATIEEVEDDEAQVNNTTHLSTAIAASRVQPLEKSDSVSSLSSAVRALFVPLLTCSYPFIQMDGKKNFVYLFYEPVPTDHDGSSDPGTKYYKCWHGSRKTFKLTAGMKYSLKSALP